jgi:hypothetical protein
VKVGFFFLGWNKIEPDLGAVAIIYIRVWAFAGCDRKVLYILASIFLVGFHVHHTDFEIPIPFSYFRSWMSSLSRSSENMSLQWKVREIVPPTAKGKG